MTRLLAHALRLLAVTGIVLGLALATSAASGHARHHVVAGYTCLTCG